MAVAWPQYDLLVDVDAELGDAEAILEADFLPSDATWAGTAGTVSATGTTGSFTADGITLVAQVGGQTSGGHGTGPATTSSFTPPDNSKLVAIVGVITNGGATDPSGDLTITDSLGGAGWTSSVAVGNANAWSIGLRIFTKDITTGTSMTVSFDCGSTDAYAYEYGIVALTGVGSVGATASDGNTATDGAEALTLSAAPAASSLIIGAVMQDPQGGAGAVPDSGLVELYEFDNSGAGIQVQYRAPGSTSTSFGWSDIGQASTLYKAVAAAIEVTAAAAGPATWDGNTGSVSASSAGSSFAPGAAAWTRSATQTVTATASSSTFSPGPATWTRSATQQVSATASSSTFAPGVASWTRSAVQEVSATGTSGTWSSTGAWAGTTAAVTVAASSGAFTPGATSWARTAAAVAVAAPSAPFTPGPSSWPASSGPSIVATGTTGSWSAVATWAGNPAACAAASSSSPFTPGLATWAATAGAGSITASSATFTPGGHAWSGTAGVITCQTDGGVWVSLLLWPGSDAVVVCTATGGVFDPGGVDWPGSVDVQLVGSPPRIWQVVPNPSLKNPLGVWQGLDRMRYPRFPRLPR